MELKKAAAIAGVATLGYLGYALITAPTSKISRAEGVCSCGTECVCECGCAESGVCNCGPSCPCDCGCGDAPTDPITGLPYSKSFDAEYSPKKKAEDDDYVDYTMWIYTEKSGGQMNGEWEDGQPEEQVIKEFNEAVEEALADDLDKLLSAELRKHSSYVEEDGDWISKYEETIATYGDFEAEYHEAEEIREAGFDYCLFCGDNGDEGEETINTTFMCFEHGCTCDECFCHSCHSELCIQCGGLHWNAGDIDLYECKSPHFKCSCESPHEAESLEATNKSWIVKEYPHTISESQHKEVMDALDYYEENFRVKLYVRYGDTIRILTTTIPIPTTHHILPTFSAESFGAEAQAVIIKGKNRRGLPEDRAHIIGQMEKDDFTPTTIINTDTGNMEGIGRIPLGDKFANHHKFAESFSAEMLGNPVRKYEKTALHIHNFDAFKRQSDLLSEETKRLYRLIDTSKSVDESQAIKRAITEVYNAIDILHGGYWDYGAESFATDYEPDTYCDTGCGKKWVCEECERCGACCDCIEGECQVEDCEGTPCDECGLCDICEGGDINPCCARRTYGMRKGWGAESFGADIWDSYTVAYNNHFDTQEIDDDYEDLNEAMSAYQYLINQGYEEVVIKGYTMNENGDYEADSKPVAEYSKGAYDNRPQGYSAESFGAESVWCDNCGDDLGEEDAQLGDVHVIQFMPVDFDSGEAGESATICGKCYEDLVGLDAESFEAEVRRVGVWRCEGCQRTYYLKDDAIGCCWDKNAESSSAELKKDSCCCGATKSKPCACMIQGVIDCNATCPCSLEKKAESSSAEEIWVKNAEGNFLGHISEAEWSYLKHETEDDWAGEAITEMALWDEEDEGADEDAIAHYTANFNNENYLAEYMAEPRKGGKSRFMDSKQVIDLFKKANGTLVSVTFVKRTNGEIRRMLARTSVRKGVKGVGLKFKPSDKNLMGVYDFGEVRKGADPWKCYRFVPVDAVLTMRVRGKTYTA